MKLVDVTEIEPSTYNPRIADPARLDLIELSLRKLGFLLPLDIPLGEESERYEVEIYSGLTLKRTLTATSPTVAYSAANQVTDFGSTQSSVSVKVYQLSAVVGRGYPAIASV